jgi:hypothetical protein
MCVLSASRMQPRHAFYYVGSSTLGLQRALRRSTCHFYFYVWRNVVQVSLLHPSELLTVAGCRSVTVSASFRLIRCEAGSCLKCWEVQQRTVRSLLCNNNNNNNNTLCCTLIPDAQFDPSPVIVWLTLGKVAFWKFTFRALHLPHSVPLYQSSIFIHSFTNLFIHSFFYNRHNMHLAFCSYLKLKRHMAGFRVNDN